MVENAEASSSSLKGAAWALIEAAMRDFGDWTNALDVGFETAMDRAFDSLASRSDGLVAPSTGQRFTVEAVPDLVAQLKRLLPPTLSGRADETAIRWPPTIEVGWAVERVLAQRAGTDSALPFLIRTHLRARLYAAHFIHKRLHGRTHGSRRPLPTDGWSATAAPSTSALSATIRALLPGGYTERDLNAVARCSVELGRAFPAAVLRAIDASVLPLAAQCGLSWPKDWLARLTLASALPAGASAAPRVDQEWQARLLDLHPPVADVWGAPNGEIRQSVPMEHEVSIDGKWVVAATGPWPVIRSGLGRSVALVADPGMGKTALLSEEVRAAASSTVVPVHVTADALARCWQSSEGDCRSTLRAIVADRDMARRAWLTPSSTSLLVDGFDEAAGPLRRTLIRDVFPVMLNDEGVGSLIVASRPNHARELDAMCPERVRLGNLSTTQVTAVIRAWFNSPEVGVGRSEAILARDSLLDLVDSDPDFASLLTVPLFAVLACLSWAPRHGFVADHPVRPLRPTSKSALLAAAVVDRLAGVGSPEVERPDTYRLRRLVWAAERIAETWLTLTTQTPGDPSGASIDVVDYTSLIDAVQHRHGVAPELVDAIFLGPDVRNPGLMTGTADNIRFIHRQILEWLVGSYIAGLPHGTVDAFPTVTQPPATQREAVTQRLLPMSRQLSSPASLEAYEWTHPLIFAGSELHRRDDADSASYVDTVSRLQSHMGLTILASRDVTGPIDLPESYKALAKSLAGRYEIAPLFSILAPDEMFEFLNDFNQYGFPANIGAGVPPATAKRFVAYLDEVDDPSWVTHTLMSARDGNLVAAVLDWLREHDREIEKSRFFGVVPDGPATEACTRLATSSAPTHLRAWAIHSLAERSLVPASLLRAMVVPEDQFGGESLRPSDPHKTFVELFAHVAYSNPLDLISTVRPAEQAALWCEVFDGFFHDPASRLASSDQALRLLRLVPPTDPSGAIEARLAALLNGVDAASAPILAQEAVRAMERIGASAYAFSPTASPGTERDGPATHPVTLAEERQAILASPVRPNEACGLAIARLSEEAKGGSLHAEQIVQELTTSLPYAPTLWLLVASSSADRNSAMDDAIAEFLAGQHGIEPSTAPWQVAWDAFRSQPDRALYIARRALPHAPRTVAAQVLDHLASVTNRVTDLTGLDAVQLAVHACRDRSGLHEVIGLLNGKELGAAVALGWARHLLADVDPLWVLSLIGENLAPEHVPILITLGPDKTLRQLLALAERLDPTSGTELERWRRRSALDEIARAIPFDLLLHQMSQPEVRKSVLRLVARDRAPLEGTASLGVATLVALFKGDAESLLRAPDQAVIHNLQPL